MADYHSHWANPGYRYNEFSSDDKFKNYIDKQPGYLVLPGGDLLRYNPQPASEDFDSTKGETTKIKKCPDKYNWRNNMIQRIPTFFCHYDFNMYADRAECRTGRLA
ncbi:DUF4329 domain-containing protein [Methylococcus sp. Mc7]|uniref:DUF4329 domain-containing protein n=1 Tax=Methylococcus sp. Mc7 TaxID=2860258 RepID=UPI001C527B5C|nr:DUF4329 domain-containing protein [Methylococcus sp. Mc7]QXP85191.1 DUF4329 domain-containing protein [Methylococcus sp. Mc7]